MTEQVTSRAHSVTWAADPAYLCCPIARNCQNHGARCAREAQRGCFFLHVCVCVCVCCCVWKRLQPLQTAGRRSTLEGLKYLQSSSLAAPRSFRSQVIFDFVLLSIKTYVISILCQQSVSKRWVPPNWFCLKGMWHWYIVLIRLQSRNSAVEIAMVKRCSTALFMLFYIRVPAGIPRLLPRQASAEEVSAVYKDLPPEAQANLKEALAALHKAWNRWAYGWWPVGKWGQMTHEPNRILFQTNPGIETVKTVGEFVLRFFSFLLPAHRDSDPKTVCV